jgi:hypothetical protein
MNRKPKNPNHTLHYGDTYLGLPIQIDKGPFPSEYLGRLHETVCCAVNQYSRVFAFRVDLRLPSGRDSTSFTYANEIIDLFIESFKAKIKHNRQMARKLNKYACDTIVRFVWAREFGQHGRPHYHLAILLNHDAFFTLGRFKPGRDNIFNRLQEALASALRQPVEGISGLIHIPDNACYHIYRENDASIAEFFYRASYLCKAETKGFGDGGHGFGASRG